MILEEVLRISFYLPDLPNKSGVLEIMSKNTVFVVDDNDDFRKSISWMLRGEGFWTIEFECPQKAINALKNAEKSQLKNSCLLLDVRMPLMSGLEFHEKLLNQQIGIPVVYMTGHGDVALAVEAMKKGAVTMLEKPLNLKQLSIAIETALAQAITQNPVDHVLDVSTTQLAKFKCLLKTLTPRETEVLHSLVNGNQNKIIASNLDISVRTVEVHRARLLKKLAVRSASELVKMVIKCQVNAY